VNVPNLAEFSVSNLYEDAMKDAWIARFLPDPTNKPLNREYLCTVRTTETDAVQVINSLRPEYFAQVIHQASKRRMDKGLEKA
jgi:hypothetical protein